MRLQVSQFNFSNAQANVICLLNSISLTHDNSVAVRLFLNILVSFLCRMPVSVRRSAADMIVAMLQSNPQKRPSVNKLYHYEFIKGHHIPSFLPSSCLSMAPRADEIEGGEREIGINRRPLLEINDNLGITKVVVFKNIFNFGLFTLRSLYGKLRCNW